MRFEELASRAGTTAAEVGRRVDRPSFPGIVARRHRRMLFAGWSTAAAAVIVALGMVWLWPGSGAPVAAGDATSTTQTEATTSGVIDGSREVCPISYPDQVPFTPPADISLSLDGDVWYGTPELWTFIQRDGQMWEGLPVGTDGSLTQKTFWWTPDYTSISEPVPDITFTAEHVVGAAAMVEAAAVTNGGHPEMGVFIIAGFEIPQAGCWRITASYGDASLSYVAWAEGR